LVVFFNYGSKHNAEEIKYAKYNCERLNIPHKEIKLDLNELGFKSDLLKSGGDIPKGHYEDETMKSTVVPFRNGIMLSIAAGLAESIECSGILISNHFGDHAIYPDCRASFIDPMYEAIKEGTYLKVEVLAPFTQLTKREVALIGKELEVDFAKTYSCYEGKETHCGECGTCTERKEALEGFDPTQYRK
jgi:7-cyano-7-deazaguanine synthase